MKPTIVGQLVTADGSNCASYFSHDPAHMWSPIRRKCWVIRTSELRHEQRTPIPLRLVHRTGPPVGEIVLLEKRSDQSLWCVAELDEDMRPDRDRNYYLSVEVSMNPDGSDITVDGAAIVDRSASTGLHALIWIQTNGLTADRKAQSQLGQWPRSLLEHADDTRRRHRAGEPLRIRTASPYEGRNLGSLNVAERHQLLEDQDWDRKAEHRPAGQLWWRPSTITAVR